ncbi:carbohydrate ABC transporter membrane protein 1 (CUT1 family) [Haloactinopolyspora alba]|uniref:Carbohydrate ABC transporter membrane protein 1 (CUT1 family) n=1 Tax=Haloactinopolyspora alba TaxID=648780 RepID=A0A2P8E958_9ACTN|nr:sugar ABC transporter permease [Haloactinopolyspora alba]PSL06012.1 carbohydrate ABC transporter membrane protein 1 (CUT1 family) [Haloactinopolyspora alba]
MTVLATKPSRPHATQDRPRRRRTPLERREAFAGVVFVLPVLIIFLMFRFLPIAGAGGMSLTEYAINGEATFLGAENYQRLLNDDVFWHSLGVTVLYVAVFVPMILVVAMVAALLLESIVKLNGLFRSLLFLPYVTSFVMAGIIWTWIYSSDGPINSVLSAIDLPAIGFITGDQILVLASLALVSVWKGFGYAMLILLAGLKAQSGDIREAARIDGANGWQTFWLVTLPMLKPVVFFVLVIETIFSFKVFDTMYVMTGGGPSRASYTLIYMLYDQGFRFFDFGYAAAIGMALFVVVLALSLVQRRIFERKEA